ncbi:hypothetical protein [Mucilaginibacter ginsenosidivorans]|uniref:Uncharacterized protein n=1 Tax=Mucilaginibacter ginsenosidivorans TaxID=398053 RepID=A0A5B8USU4_9SPHI|nr:hypothetical protein [Mucilaginibacter ginsenosidivorans]QEC62170.1 hypothetical protein FRZ54_06090 [Mucilaginibacter ginsenosidivorans]
MKKIVRVLLPLFVVTSVLNGCKKDGAATNKQVSTKDFYIKLKVNGVAKTMTVNATTVSGVVSGVIHAMSVSAQFTSNPAAGVTIGLNDGAAYNTTTTYTGKYIEVSGITTIQTTFTYKDEDNSTYLASPAAAGTNVTLNISEVANDHFKGTFSGKLIKSGTTASFITVTDGEFYVGRSL